MKNKILICLFALCLLLSPFGAFAQEGDMLSETSAAASALQASLYQAGEIAGEPKVAVAYNRDAQETPDDLPSIGSRAAFAADPVSGKVFYEKNAHKKMYPASTTKLLTALLVLENCSMEETAVVSKKAVSLVPDGYVRANLQPGETFSVHDLLRVLLVPSANDAAFVLAEHVGGSVRAFAALCNERAKALGCEKLHFVNPNGIHNKDHYCTAYDLYLIARECRKYDTFNEIVQTGSVSLPATDLYRSADRTFRNTNLLLDPTASAYYTPGCTGMKTGYTPEAGQCMVAACSDGGLDVICVVLGGAVRPNGVNERFSDSKALLDYVNVHYSFTTFAERNAPLAHFTVKKATKDTSELDAIMPAAIEAVAPNSLTAENVPVQIDLPQELKAPIRQNQVLGTVTYIVDGFTYATNLIASHDVQKKPYWLYNLLVLLALIGIILLIRLALVQREKERRRRELLRRKRAQQLRRRKQNQQDIRFRR